jgi:hypothetical protein
MAVVAGVVFFAVRASARPDPWLDGPDQEMGGRGRAVRRDLLSPAVGRRGCDPGSFLTTAAVLIAVMVGRRTV